MDITTKIYILITFEIYKSKVHQPTSNDVITFTLSLAKTLNFMTFGRIMNNELRISMVI